MTGSRSALARLLGPILFAGALLNADARPTSFTAPAWQAPAKSGSQKKLSVQDDSFNAAPAKDLALQPENERKANALTDFVEATRLEENAEMEAALNVYQRVLNVDPGQAELAARVAALLARQEDFPGAIDVLKDAIKANPKQSAPYLQLAAIYAKHLKKTDQALKYANQAIALDPKNVEAYQRLFEIQMATGDTRKAASVLDRAKNIETDDATFWTRLGSLYASLIFKSGTQPKPEEVRRVNEIFKKAAAFANDDAGILKDVADYYALSQQVQEAIPLYLRALELEPEDATVREKLAAGFVVTNQRAKAIELLQEIIAQHPEKYQSYDLLAQLLDDDARSLQRANQFDRAKDTWKKAAANYEQSLLINPARGTTCLRLAEILLGPLKEPERAVKLLIESRQRFPAAPEFSYYLGLALREAKRPKEALIKFEEALHEAAGTSSTILNARFYFDYGAAAEQAGLYDKAADLLRESIALDPANSAATCNYLAYMWTDHDMHLDEAADMINRALQLEPNNGAYLDSLGWLDYKRGKFDNALNELLRAAQNLTRDDPVVFEHIGDTFVKLNRIPQALEYWQKAAALDPANKILADKIESTKMKMSKGLPTNANPL